jgi:hypothetical protein
VAKLETFRFSLKSFHFIVWTHGCIYVPDGILPSKQWC